MIRRFLAVVLIAGGLVYFVRSVPQFGQRAASRVTMPVTEGFDPMVRFASFGWLPPDVVQRTTIVQSGAYTIEAGSPKRSTGSSVAVTFFPKGVKAKLDCLAAAELHRRSSSEQITWNYAADAEAVITGQVDRKTLQRIANDLYHGGTERLRFPAIVRGVPQRLMPQVVTVTERSKASWSMGILLGPEKICLGKELPSGAVTVKVDAFVPGLGWGGGQSNTKVDGHFANRQTSPTGGEGLIVFDVPGPNITVGGSDAAAVASLGAGGVDGLYRRIEVLGEVPKVPDAPVDMTKWTDNPLP